ncbi:MAG: EscU/YscU/HrcU family type III secretion system export apparatus switch protein [Opitutus sp.]|nr:EscU/YscU/HrcU family type III secretion system export apparatus switch protein [Opitutus sp.]MCS6248005.1 EscU/YscU/HrcU family type III secretion system export apparatus switch protein [Opitutus sp.]MCS6273381.1 EscU/YscU/HrcU family type III secretion system export apparatus switch protein [Opitutus sp.]MCS6277447.1 EscU/YscU/HrcU family type III secretion system export apparatus switch protein [Opitutus sp.]MCS6300564.1 EscU/YscU/HrcU family type III secretion system export apparatus swi
MADDDKDSKTEEASGKRLTEAHDKGQFARSAELGMVCSLAAAFFSLSLGAASGAREVAEYTSNVLAHLSIDPFAPGHLPLPLVAAGKVVAIVLAPILVATVVASLLAGGLQSGFQLTPEALGFKLEKLNPIPGFQRLVSQQVVVSGCVDFMKMCAIGVCLWLALKQLLADPLFTTPMEVAYLGQFMLGSMRSLLSRLMLALGVIAAISYAYEKYKTGKDLMMTKEEVKEETKQAEGNALVKGAIRRMARRLAQRQMLAAVATADVVVTNPTHYAVALKYERGIDAAPMVLAKGENALARRIKALAAEHEVPMVENRPVARMLYATATVGEAIPSELYQAVAGILAFVYRTHRYYFYRLPSRRAAAAQQGGSAA